MENMFDFSGEEPDQEEDMFNRYDFPSRAREIYELYEPDLVSTKARDDALEVVKGSKSAKSLDIQLSRVLLENEE